MESLFQLRADRRRVDRNKRTMPDLVSLNEGHQEILSLALLGMKGTDIAKKLGVSYYKVLNALESTLGREKMAMMRGARDAETIDVAKRMKDVIPKALEIYERILEFGDPKSMPSALQAKVATSVLNDFSGLKVPTKVVQFSGRLTPELIAELKTNGKNAAKECGLIVDVEYKEVSNG